MNALKETLEKQLGAVKEQLKNIYLPYETALILSGKRAAFEIALELIDSLQQEQKPAAEWSDTDNIGWDEAFACVTRAEKAAKNEEELQNAVTAEKWLKEIKFKYYVHPVKQEWSEEDERMRNQLIYDVEYHKKEGLISAKQNKATKTLYNEIEKCYDEKIAWLKSLQPHWKPSEEQLLQLRCAISGCSYDIEPLVSLEKQLKQL